VAGFGFFFFPILQVKPNRLASGIDINLLELQGDWRYIILFLVALLPLVVSFLPNKSRRGWSLVAIGNLVILLTLLLPAMAGLDLLTGAETMFEEGTRIANPRILTSGAIAAGLLGGYIIVFGGQRDLADTGVPGWQRTLVSLIGPLLIVVMLAVGSLDVYSILVEFSQRGETLGQRLIEHLVFVLVALAAGLVIGIGLGLIAARDESIGNLILYAVGIIQTIPSLALFGILLVPLALLGDRTFLDLALSPALIAMAIAGLALVALLLRAPGWLDGIVRMIVIVAATGLLFLPIGLYTIVIISFGFDVVLTVFTMPDLLVPVLVVGAGFAAVILLFWVDQLIDATHRNRPLIRLRNAVLALSLLGAGAILVAATAAALPARAVENVILRDLGVSGIGTAPAIIALTLYSLLPLVRNTYVGLKNVDLAIIDSGRGMGMTPRQIFFRIELPLAFPIIMAGVRNAAIALVGIAAVASIIGAGALGDFILLGVNSTSIDLILLGAIPAVILAVLLDTGLQVLERLLTSPGLRQPTA
jgi:ABC-type proline/glycine betaine transport system permease subunit